MSGAGARGVRLSVPQRDVLLVLVVLPLIAVAGVALTYASATYGVLTVLPIFSVLVAMGVLALLGLRVAFLLLVFALAFPFRNQALITGVDLHTTHVLIPLVAILALIQLAYGRLRLPRGMLAPMGLMMLGGVIAAVAGPEPSGSMTRLIFGLGLPMLVGITAAAVIRPERDIGPLSAVLGLSLCGLGLLALAQVAGLAPGPFAPIFGERVNGLFYHPNIFGAYLAANIVLFGGIAAYRGKSGILMLVPIALGLAGLVATLSRGPFLGLVAGLLLVTVLLARRRPASLLVIVVMAPIAFAVALPEAPSSERAALAERFNQAFEPDSEQGRKAIWKDAERVIAENPLTGIGALTFADQFSQPATTSNVDADITHAHNLFLEGYMSIGPLGMLGLFWLVGGAVRRFWRASGRLDRTGRIIGGWALGSIGALFSLVVSSMVDFPFWQVEVMGFVFLLIGSAYAIDASTEEAAAEAQPGAAAASRARAAKAAIVRPRKRSVASA